MALVVGGKKEHVGLCARQEASAFPSPDQGRSLLPKDQGSTCPHSDEGESLCLSLSLYIYVCTYFTMYLYTLSSRGHIMHRYLGFYMWRISGVEG